MIVYVNVIFKCNFSKAFDTVQHSKLAFLYPVLNVNREYELLWLQMEARRSPDGTFIGQWFVPTPNACYKVMSGLYDYIKGSLEQLLESNLGGIGRSGRQLQSAGRGGSISPRRSAPTGQSTNGIS